MEAEERREEMATVELRAKNGAGAAERDDNVHEHVCLLPVHDSCDGGDWDGAVVAIVR